MSKTNIASGATYAPTAEAKKVVEPGEFVFAAAFLDHGHIYGQVNGLRDAGGTLKYVYDTEPDRIAAFIEKNPEVMVADSFEQILHDDSVRMVAAAAVTSERAGIGFRTMDAGKDYFTDKAPFTTLEQLETARARVKETGKKYMVYFSERLHNEGAMKAGELIARGAIGQVVQVVNLAPHRLSKDIRPDWFFEREKYGGIITDIGSHQFEQFLAYTNAKDATIEFARVANYTCPDKPELQDFGEAMLVADNGASFYCRIDWLTADASPVWGDGRTFVVGTEGSIEVRKYMDVARKAPDSVVFLVNGEREEEFPCLGNVGFPFFGKLILDSLNRTETAMTQEHAFKSAELALKAQALAEERL